MIAGLKGRVEEIEANHLLLDVNGVLYGVSVSLLCALELKVGEEIRLYISEIVREDAFLLFGFKDKMEQGIFERLIKISGVGPKVAMAILSTYKPKDFAQIIESKNVSALQKVSGIGAKGASKIMVDLAGFFDLALSTQEKEAHQEARMALESLGFKKNDINNVLKKVKAQDTQGIIKEALRYFQSNL